MTKNDSIPRHFLFKNPMYLFSAIKDALFSNRRSSVGGQTSRYSEPGMRRSSSEAFLLPQFSPTDSEREGPLGSKAKRVEAERVVSQDQEPKRRRTTVGGDSERVSSRLSIDRADVPSMGSRSRLPSPLPRSSAPGPLFQRRDSLMGSPLGVAPLSRMSVGSPRPHTPSNPKFVDLLRRDPSQQRALDSARSILDTLDRVTSGAYGGVGGSARKYRPPQPLRPMRFKSLSSASSRPVSLHEMLTGAASAMPSTPQAAGVNSPLMRPSTVPPLSMLEQKQAGSPRHGLSIPRAQAGSPRNLLPTQPRAHAESPRHIVAKPVTMPKKPDSPMHTAVANKPTVSAPPKGTFIWGDPTKVSDADFMDEEGFAPGAESSGSDVEVEKKKVSTDVSSIFGKPKNPEPVFGGASSAVADINDTFGPKSKSIFETKPTETTTNSVSSIFGAESEKKKAETSSLFGAVKPPAETASIFGTHTEKSSNHQPERKSEQPSIFGAVKPAESSSIFGSQPEKKSEPSVLFGSAKPAEPTTSIFGNPAEQKTGSSSAVFGSNTASIFGGQPATKNDSPIESSSVQPLATTSIFGNQTEKKPEPLSAFGGIKPAEPASIFGNQTEKKPDTAAFGSGVFGATNPSVGAGIFGAATNPVQPSSVSSIFGSQQQPEKKSDSLFGQPAADNISQPSSIFGQPKPAESSSIFGAQPQEKKPESTMFVFGATPPASPHAPSGQQTNIFGSGTPTSQPSVFGGQPPASGTSLFGQPAPSGTFGGFNPQPGTPSGGLFGAGAAPNPSGSSMFGGGQPSSSAFSFGASAGTPSSSSGLLEGMDNPFAGNTDEFKNGKRRILKARRP